MAIIPEGGEPPVFYTMQSAQQQQLPPPPPPPAAPEGPSIAEKALEKTEDVSLNILLDIGIPVLLIGGGALLLMYLGANLWKDFRCNYLAGIPLVGKLWDTGCPASSTPGRDPRNNYSDFVYNWTHAPDYDSSKPTPSEASWEQGRKLGALKKQCDDQCTGKAPVDYLACYNPCITQAAENAGLGKLPLYDS